MASNQHGHAPNFAELLADQTPAPEQVVEQAHRYERVTKLFDSALQKAVGKALNAVEAKAAVMCDGKFAEVERCDGNVVWLSFVDASSSDARSKRPPG